MGFFFLYKKQRGIIFFSRIPETYHTTILLLKHGFIDQLSYAVHPWMQGCLLCCYQKCWMKSWCTYPPVLVLVFLEDIIYCVKELLYCTGNVPVGQEKENFNILRRSQEMLELNPFLAVKYFSGQSPQRKCQT